jgi:ribosomal protein S4
MTQRIKYKAYQRTRLGWWGTSLFTFKKVYRKKFHRKKWKTWKPPRFFDNYIDYQRYRLSKFPLQTRWLYKNTLVAKQQFRYYYGNIRDFQVKTAYRRAATANMSKTLIRFFQYMENRADLLLFRIGFANSIRTARQWIQHRKVLYNGKVLTTGYASLQPGDVLHLCPSVWEEVRKGIFFRLPKKIYRFRGRRRLIRRRVLSPGLQHVPNWLEVDYTTFAIGSIRPLRIEEVSHPFRFDVWNVFRMYTYGR